MYGLLCYFVFFLRWNIFDQQYNSLIEFNKILFWVLRAIVSNFQYSLTRSLANEHELIKLNVLLSVRENICIMLHNSKYYVKSLKNNTIKSKNIVDLFKKGRGKRSAGEELESSGEDSDKCQTLKLMRYMVATISLLRRL